jgi:chromosome segregation ATPase
MDSRSDVTVDISALRKEKEEAEQTLKKAEAELRAAQQEAEWAKLALRLAEETLTPEELAASAKVKAPVPVHVPEAKASQIIRLQPKFGTMTPEAIVKEVEDMGERADASVLRPLSELYHLL